MKSTETQRSQTLPEGTVLSNNYIIGQILGIGGFGITYSGTSTLTNEKVAIKEYYPASFAHREPTPENPYQVVPVLGMDEPFEKGLQHLLNEAVILKEFQNLESIVAVKDVLEQNGTVYLVMEFVDGITLKQYIISNGPIPFNKLLPLIKPVMQSLNQIHKQGLIHRDISPDNLMLGKDNKLHLIDFGAACIENSQDANTITVMFKTGYAPPEQYLSKGIQGAWTDIYAFCATLYKALTGSTPPESIRRLQKDELPALANLTKITPWQAAAIEKGMNLTPEDRFQSMEELYQALIIPPLTTLSTQQKQSKAYEDEYEERTVLINTPPSTNKRSALIPVIIVLVVLLLIAIGALAAIMLNPSDKEISNDSTTTAATTEQVPSTEATTLCTMVNVVDLPLADAEKKIQELDDSITIHITEIYDSTHAANTVIEQSIQEGTSFTKGALGSIQLTVSLGPEPTTEATTKATTEATTAATTEAATAAPPVQSTQSQSGGTSQKNTSSKKNSSKNNSSSKDSGSSKKNNSSKNDGGFNVVPIEDDYDTFIID